MSSRGCGVPRGKLVLLRQITVPTEEPRVPKSAMPVLCRALVPEVLPAVMPDLPAVPEVLPAPLPDLVLPSRLPADLPAEGRAALAAALDGSTSRKKLFRFRHGHPVADGQGTCKVLDRLSA